MRAAGCRSLWEKKLKLEEIAKGALVAGLEPGKVARIISVNSN